MLEGGEGGLVVVLKLVRYDGAGDICGLSDIIVMI